MSEDVPPVPWFVRPGFGDVPVGAVIAFAGNLGPPDYVGSPAASPPDAPSGTTWPLEAWGWMACDGRVLPIRDYGELYAAIGQIYGGSGSGTDGTFALPNYCGYFLRCIDIGQSIDTDTRTIAPGPQAIANGVGSTQLSALLTHNHDTPKFTPSVTAEAGTDSGAPGTQTDVTGPPVNASGGALSPPASATETRPINIGVNYIIKFTSGLRPTLPGSR